jgi:hypothetical protein
MTTEDDMEEMRERQGFHRPEEAADDEAADDKQAGRLPVWKLLTNKQTGSKWLWNRLNGFSKNIGDADIMAVPPEDFQEKWHMVDRLGIIKSQLKEVWQVKKRLEHQLEDMLSGSQVGGSIDAREHEFLRNQLDKVIAKEVIVTQIYGTVQLEILGAESDDSEAPGGEAQDEEAISNEKDIDNNDAEEDIKNNDEEDIENNDEEYLMKGTFHDTKIKNKELPRQHQDGHRTDGTYPRTSTWWRKSTFRAYTSMEEEEVVDLTPQRRNPLDKKRSLGDR